MERMSARSTALFGAHSSLSSYRLFLNRRAEVAALEELARKTASAASAARAAALHASPTATDNASLPSPSVGLTPRQPQRRSDDGCGAQEGDGGAAELVAPDGSSPSEFRRRDTRAAEWAWQRRWQLQQQIRQQNGTNNSSQHEQRRRDVSTAVDALAQCASPRQYQQQHQQQHRQQHQQQQDPQQQLRKHVMDDIGSIQYDNSSCFDNSSCSLATSQSTITIDSKLVSHNSVSPGNVVSCSRALAMAPKTTPCTSRRTENWY